MDNAAKALEIAGGVLVAILIVSLFIYMFNLVSENQALQNEQVENERLEAFNKKYQAYNKSILYGADVISVINMAISNNATEESDEYHISVDVALQSDVAVIIETYQNDELISKTSTTAITAKTYTNVEEEGANQVQLLDDTWVEFIEAITPNSEGTVLKTVRRSNTVYVSKGADEDFISKIFTCSSVKYSANTGRINYMSFDELNTTSGTTTY